MDVGYQAYSLINTGKDYFGTVLPLFPHSFAEFRTPLIIYSTTPTVSILGLSPLAIRLPQVIWGLIGIFAVYYLAKQIYPKAAIFSALSLGLAPWGLVYSRIGFEVVILSTLITLAIGTLVKSLNNPRLLPLSALFFGLSLYSYSTAKLFIPIFIFIALIIFVINKITIPKKYILSSIILLSIFSVPLYYDSVFGNNAGRFLNVSILTDPVAADEVNQQRFESAVSRISGPAQVGLSPTVIDKALFNRPANLLNKFMGNYLSAFSTDFLFTKGDPQTRHSPSKELFGQFHVSEFIPLIVGMILLIKLQPKYKYLIIAWILLSPVASSLTRDGSMHASRLILLFPVLSLIIGIGFYRIFRYQKLVFILLLGFYFYNVFNFMGFYLTRYKLESAQSFDYGFEQIMQIANIESKKYNRVFVDVGSNNSGLMAYIFTSLRPDKIQKMHPLHTTEISDGISGYVFGNIVVTQSGTRHWTKAKLPENSLIISQSNQPLLGSDIKPTETIFYPDKTPAFFIFNR